MLSTAVKRTTEYAEQSLLNNRKEIGQYFTCESTATFMAGLLHTSRSTVKILDPGVGSGILSIALITELVKRKTVKEIHLDMYEIDEKIIPILTANVALLQRDCNNSGIQLYVSIKLENYILSNLNDWKNSEAQNQYDLIISNPPYKKVSASSPEAIVMKDIVYGQPNLYFLFMAMSLKQLVTGGELAYIVPRSWTSGTYFRKFREFLFNYGDIQHIHIFKSRNKVFQNEDVLQETIIIHVRKGNQGNSIKISESNTSSNFSDLYELEIPKSVCISPSKILFLPLSQGDIGILKKINTLSNSLVRMGAIARTGKVVDFRNKDLLKEEPSDTTVPLIWSSNFINGRIKHPCGKEVQFISNSNNALLMKNGNYLFIKRFSSKEEPKRLHVAIYFNELFSDYLAAENHLNYIDCTSLNENIVWGLYAVFNSTLWDSYLRLFNGSTQVNAGDINGLPLPSVNVLENIGRLVIQNKKRIDEIVEEVIQ